jgi:dolichyl-phosphate beta-glucosyltransferase
MPAAVRLVVPCYNEAARLDVAKFRAGLAADSEVSLTLVDDGSRDGTLALLKGLQTAHPDRVDVVALPENLGKGEAVRAGLVSALAHRPTFCGWWDADLATPLNELMGLRSALDAQPTAWLAMGSRVQTLGTQIDRRASRHYAGRVVATWISRTLRMPIYDTQCGAKLFRAAATPVGVVDEPFLTRWLFDVEVIARLKRRFLDGFGPSPESLVTEIPLRRWTDVPGSKVRATDFVRAYFGLRRIRRHYRLP